MEAVDFSSLIKLKDVYPDVRVRIIRVLNDMGNLNLPMRVVSAYRSVKEQDELFHQGRDEQGKVTNPEIIVTHSKPGRSWHNFGLAVDCCFRGTDPYWEYLRLRDLLEFTSRWETYGRVVRAHGFEWGGDFNSFPDRPHAQLRYGLTLDTVSNLDRLGGLQSVWKKIDMLRLCPSPPEPPQAA